MSDAIFWMWRWLGSHLAHDDRELWKQRNSIHVQVVGLSGGDFIVARDNVMVSARWADSNVPYYSGDYTKRELVCSNHVVENNRSNWINRNGGLSTFATNSTCLPLTKAGNTFRDLSLTEAVWDTWSPSP